MTTKVTASGSSTSTSQESGGRPPGYDYSTSNGPSNTAEDISQRASELTDTAKQVASEAGERLTITIEDQKRAGAQRLSQFAEAVVTAANHLDQNSPEFARYIRGAAEQVQGFSEKLRTQKASELFNEFQSFAKRHPTAFLGATVLTGFALARFFKSATETPGSSTASSGTHKQSEASRVSTAGSNQRAQVS